MLNYYIILLHAGDWTMTKLLINCGLTQNSHCIQEILLKVSILKEDYQKAWKKVTLFLSLKPSPF